MRSRREDTEPACSVRATFHVKKNPAIPAVCSDLEVGPWFGHRRHSLRMFSDHGPRGARTFPGGSAVGPSHQSPRVCGFQAHEAREVFHSRNPLPSPLTSVNSLSPRPTALSRVRHPSFEMFNNTREESTLPPKSPRLTMSPRLRFSKRLDQLSRASSSNTTWAPTVLLSFEEVGDVRDSPRPGRSLLSSRT